MKVIVYYMAFNLVTSQEEIDAAMAAKKKELQELFGQHQKILMMVRREDPVWGDTVEVMDLTLPMVTMYPSTLPTAFPTSPTYTYTTTMADWPPKAT